MPLMHCRLCLLVLMAAMPVALPSVPAEAAIQSEIEETIVVGRRQPTTLDELANPAALVSAEQLRLIEPRHIKEALNRLAGVNLQRGSGQEYLPAVRSPVLVGAGGCGGLLTAQDGVPLRAAGFCNLNELFEAHSEQAERIELWRGPGPVYYGSNAVHGIINVISPRMERGRHLFVGAGEYGWRRIKAGSGDERGGTALTMTEDRGWREGARVHQAKLSARRRFQWRGGDAQAIANLAHLEQDTAGFVVGRKSYKNTALARANSADGAFRNASSLRAHAELQSGPWRVTPYVRLARMRFLQHFLPGTPVEYNRHASLGVQSARSLGPWSWGLDGEYTDAALRQAQERETPGSAFLRETIPQGAHYDYRVRALMLAAFAERRWRRGPLRLSMGARLEYQRYDYRNRLPDGRTRDDGSNCGLGGCRYSRPADSDDDYLNLSPRLGLVWQLPVGQWYAALSHGFRAPQATELYRLQREQRVADLESENALGLDAGWRGASARANWRLGGYWMRKSNLIFRDSQFFNRSDGASRHRGLEAELSLALDAAQRWHMQASASWSLHSDADSGSRLEGAPRTLASLHLQWRPGASTWEIQAQHQGGYLLDADGPHRYPGHSLLHLAGSWQLRGAWRLSLQLNNILDRRHAERADHTAFSGYRYLPGRPRTLRLGVQWTGAGAL